MAIQLNDKSKWAWAKCGLSRRPVIIKTFRLYKLLKLISGKSTTSVQYPNLSLNIKPSVSMTPWFCLIDLILISLILSSSKYSICFNSNGGLK